jgi:hypothetical protein
VTTMIDRFFGVPQAVVRLGIWAEMKPTEQSLYICLMHDSERYKTRELRRTDAELSTLSGLSSRSFCNARKKLQERRLFVCKRGSGNSYVYTLCDPETGQPWPGDPKRAVPYLKKITVKTNGQPCMGNSSIVPAETAESVHHGVPLSF